jgi:hypothetical protein
MISIYRQTAKARQVRPADRVEGPTDLAKLGKDFPAELGVAGQGKGSALHGLLPRFEKPNGPGIFPAVLPGKPGFGVAVWQQSGGGPFMVRAARHCH